MRQTNILIIMADEHNRAMLGCAGHPLVKTPNLDALRSQSVSFENAYGEGQPTIQMRRNLMTGIFRGGNRPLDLYRRIKVGIGGTIMPEASPELSDDDIFDIVYYVLSIAASNDAARIQEARATAADPAADHGQEDR